MLAGTAGSVIATNVDELMRAGQGVAQATEIAQAYAAQGERAAGIMYRAPDGSVLLLLRRAETEDFPLTWCFPGGSIDEGETAEQAAIRESQEEVGFAPSEALRLVDYVDGFMTFAYDVQAPFVPVLNHEHLGYVWVPLTGLPSPMHPGCAITLARVPAVLPGDGMDARTVDGNGWFEVRGNPISRAGIFPYSGRQLGLTGANANRIYQVLRPPEELADPACIESFKLIPWIDDHVMLGPTAQDATSNAMAAEQKGVQGVIGEEVFFKDGTLFANIKAFSSTLAALITAGKKELSAGYRCIYEMAAGVWNGQPYDAVQRQIRGNHLALVSEGRMGPGVAVMDRMTFTFDAQEATTMADEKKEGGEGGGGAASTMTLAEALAMINELAPQVAKLQAAIASMTKTEPAAEEKSALEIDKAPEAANPPPAAVIEPKPAAVDEKPAIAGMDAAMIERHIMGRVAQRDALAKQISAHVGTFDHAEKSLEDVVAYGCDKLGIKAVKGHEAATLAGFLQARPAALPTASTGMDSGTVRAGSFVAKHLNKGA